MIRSFFIGVGVMLMYVVFAPITLLWLIGERHQGRTSIALIDDDVPTIKGVLLVGFASIETIAGVAGLIAWLT